MDRNLRASQSQRFKPNRHNTLKNNLGLSKKRIRTLQWNTPITGCAGLTRTAGDVKMIPPSNKSITSGWDAACSVVQNQLSGTLTDRQRKSKGNQKQNCVLIIGINISKEGNAVLEEEKRFTFIAIAPPVECPYMKHGRPGYSALTRWRNSICSESNYSNQWLYERDYLWFKSCTYTGTRSMHYWILSK